MNINTIGIPYDKIMIERGGFIIVDPVLAVQFSIDPGTYWVDSDGEMTLTRKYEYEPERKLSKFLIVDPKPNWSRLLGGAWPELNPHPGVQGMEKIELITERSKPGKFALRMKHKETGDSIVVAEGRANEIFDLKEAMERVGKGVPPSFTIARDPMDPSTWPSSSAR